jgi:hypothetical protein
MTKEEAIKQLKIELSKWESDCKSYHKTKDALDMGIKALQDKSYELWKESYVVEHQRNIRLEEKIKELEKEPCEDAVSRISLLNKLDDCYKEKIKVAPDNMAEGFMQVEKLIMQEPSVTPVACIATVKFNKEDMRELVDEKVKELKTMAGDMVTSSIKQEPVLDKIKAEIEQSYCTVNNGYDRGRNYGLYMATQIIDKYKTESED